MRIDREKFPSLLPVLMAAALGISTVGCRGSANLEPVKPAVVTSTPVVLPDVCLTSAEVLRPPSLSRESVITYPAGVVINQAGGLTDLAVNIPHLMRLDNEPALGLSAPGHIKIIYFFAGSLYRPDALEQVDLFFQAQRPYLLARYCEEQGSPANSSVLIALSVADAMVEVPNRTPNELERVLAENYIRGARIIIGDPLGRTPRELPLDVIDRALSGGLPFRVVGWYNNINESSFGT